MENASDFIIENSVLKSYIGSESKIEIPAGVTEIATCAFYSCGGLYEVIIPDGVKKICEEAFCCCKDLGIVRIPASVTEIDRLAFGISEFSMAIYAAEGSEAELFAKENGIPLNKPSEFDLGDKETVPAPTAPAFKTTWTYKPDLYGVNPEEELYAFGYQCDDALPNLLALRLNAIKEQYGDSPSDYDRQSLLQVARMHGADMRETYIQSTRATLYRIWFDAYCEVCGKRPSSRIADAALLLLEKGILCPASSETGVSGSRNEDGELSENYDSLTLKDAAGKLILFPQWKLTGDGEFIRYDVDIRGYASTILERELVDPPVFEDLTPGGFGWSTIQDVPEAYFAEFSNGFDFVREYAPCRISNLRAEHEAY